MEWDPTRPIKENSQLSKILSEEARFLYEDLNNNKLRTTVIPAPDSHFEEHKIRVAESHPPQWYRKIYHNYSFEAEYRSKKTGRKRKYLNSSISRKESLKSLKRISEMRDKPNIFYDTLYRELIIKNLEKYGFPEIENEDYFKIEGDEDYFKIEGDEDFII